MNTKTAKRLRREARYHPSMPRKYIRVEVKKRLQNGKTVIRYIEMLEDSDPRTLYKELKRETK